jgi:hypothetical protein
MPPLIELSDQPSADLPAAANDDDLHIGFLSLRP